MTYIVLAASGRKRSLKLLRGKAERERCIFLRPLSPGDDASAATTSLHTRIADCVMVKSRTLFYSSNKKGEKRDRDRRKRDCQESGSIGLKKTKARGNTHFHVMLIFEGKRQR